MPGHGLLFAFQKLHGIILFNHISKEKSLMSNKKPEKKQTMARILALVIAGVMTFSIVLTIVLR